jgi:hypothetical protein
MNTNLLSIVKQIIAQYGEGILADPARLKSLFSDMAMNEPKPLRIAFGRCMEAGAYMVLKTAPPSERAARKADIARQVCGSAGLDISLCAEALDILEAALFGGQSYNSACAAPRQSAPKRNTPLYIAAAAALLVMIIGALVVSRRDTSVTGGESGEYGAIMTMKERVRAAGGNVDGTLRFSIQWNDGEYNPNDFDAHCIEPDGNRIYFGDPDGHPSGGNLDVDIVMPIKGTPAVENITWPSARTMREGDHTFFVHCFSYNGGRNGFSAEIEYDGQIFPFTHDKELRQDETVLVAVVNYSQSNGFKLVGIDE